MNNASFYNRPFLTSFLYAFGYTYNSKEYRRNFIIVANARLYRIVF